jgi:hypothetical protein
LVAPVDEPYAYDKKISVTPLSHIDRL